jgi:hypothetical protein
MSLNRARIYATRKTRLPIINPESVTNPYRIPEKDVRAFEEKREYQPAPTDPK